MFDAKIGNHTLVFQIPTNSRGEQIDIPNERSIQDQIQKRELKNLNQVKEKYSSHIPAN